jgi:hypothetical protein
MNVEKIRTFTATAVALAARIRVKHTAGAATVEVAGAGEQHVGVTEYACAASSEVALKLLNFPGSVEMTASKIIAVGATIYGAAAGKVSDAAVGSAIGIALEAAGANGDIIEVLPFHVLSTTAATVSIADAGNYTAAATVEAALQELYLNGVSVQGFIPLKLTDFRELAAGVFINAAGHGGILATDTTPILTNIADGDGMRIAWAAGNTDQIETQVIVPPDIDLTAAMVVHMLCSKDANVNNACHMDGEAYFGESDVDCFPAAAAANLLIDTKAEYTATILAADLPPNQTRANMTLVIMPEAHAGDVVYLHGVWIEYKRTILTS